MKRVARLVVGLLILAAVSLPFDSASWIVELADSLAAAGRTAQVRADEVAGSTDQAWHDLDSLPDDSGWVEAGDVADESTTASGADYELWQDTACQDAACQDAACQDAACQDAACQDAACDHSAPCFDCEGASRIDQQFDRWTAEFDALEPEGDGATPTPSAPRVAAQPAFDPFGTSEGLTMSPQQPSLRPTPRGAALPSRPNSAHTPAALARSATGAAWSASHRSGAGNPFADRNPVRPQARPVQRTSYETPGLRTDSEPAHRLAPLDANSPDSADSENPVDEHLTSGSLAGPQSATTLSGGRPQLTIGWSSPRLISLGQQATCQLTVRNTGDAAAEGVQLVVELPEHARLDACQPAGQSQGTEQFWQWGSIAAGQEESITLLVTPTSAEPIQPQTAVSFRQSPVEAIEIVEPELVLEVAGATEGALDQPFTVRATVRNVGRGAATQAVLHAQFDDHLSHAQGQRARFGLGTLAAGETRTIDVPLLGRQAGSAQMQWAVTCGEQVLARQESQCLVAAPTLNLVIDGPQRRFVDRPATYVLTVENPGPAAVENVEVFQQVPEGFQFIEANAGGSYDGHTGRVVWQVGHLPGQQTTRLGLRLVPKQLGQKVLEAVAHFDGGEPVPAETLTEVDGVAVLALEVYDQDDPIEVAGRTQYEIHVENRGSIAADHVQLVCRASDQIQIVQADGATAAQVGSNQVGFAVIDRLEPGQSLVYRVQVRCEASGRARFQALVRSDADQQGLIEEEFTQVYAD